MLSDTVEVTFDLGPMLYTDLQKVDLSTVIINLPDAVTLQYSSSGCGDPSHKITSLLLHNYNFATAINYNVNT